MTLADVEERLANIRDVAGDDEVAHSRQDELLGDVLLAIATGKAEDPRALAELTLTVFDIEFERWCA